MIRGQRGAAPWTSPRWCATSRHGIRLRSVAQHSRGTSKGPSRAHAASDRKVGRAVQRRVAIVGAALSDIGRVDDKTAFELVYQGTTRALADAGLTKDDVGGFMSGGLGQ